VVTLTKESKAPDGTILWQWDDSKDAPMKESSAYNLTSYTHLKKHPVWNVIDSALEELIENDDIAERIERDRIVGYLIEELMHYYCFDRQES
jgi:hypothetical protein